MVVGAYDKRGKPVKAVMHEAGIAECLSSLQAYARVRCRAGQKGIPLNMVQRWLGHAVSRRLPSMQAR